MVSAPLWHECGTTLACSTIQAIWLNTLSVRDDLSRGAQGQRRAERLHALLGLRVDHRAGVVLRLCHERKKTAPLFGDVPTVDARPGDKLRCMFVRALPAAALWSAISSECSAARTYPST
jgi:hypothetical protein